MSYKCPHDLLHKINAAIDAGEFASRNDIISAALRLFFEYNDKTAKDDVKKWLMSTEGEEWMRNKIHKVLEEMK